MSRLIVDTSVAVKWFVPEPYAEPARSVLTGDHQLLAPDLLFAEFGNVMWKRVRSGEMTAEEATAVVSGLLQVPLQARPSRDLALAALEIANRTQRTVYDGLYLALAVSEGASLVTADERAIQCGQGHSPWRARRVGS